MQSKVCFRCNQAKPIDSFYAHPGMADGRLGKCKECTKADTRANRELRKDYYQKYDRERANIPKRVAARKAHEKTDAYAKSHKRSTAKWLVSNRTRRKAQIAVGNAIRSGLLARQPCHICGRDAEAHHPDYSRALDVVWLCSAHHARLHAEHREHMRQLNQLISQHATKAEP